MPLARVGEIDLNYEIVDCTEPWKATRPPLVFLHGLGGNRRLFLFQVPEFCRKFPVITIDLRGHGESSQPAADWTIADAALDVVRLLRLLGVERAHMAGVSLGGMVTQQFALDYPYATASLIAVDTLCGPPAGYEEQMRAALRDIEEKPMSEIAQSRITNAFSDKVDPVMREYVIGQIARNEKESYVRAARAAWSFSVGGRLGEVRAPTLVIVGDQDRVTPPFLSEEIAAKIVGAKLVQIPDCGHISNLEKPEEFNRALMQFLLALGEP
jgi:pimeloyl-ACP methyl ester carboxylesterase